MKYRTKPIKVKVVCVVCNHRMTITDKNNTGDIPVCPKCYAPMATDKVIK